VSVYYDPMIAKLVVWENDRDSAIKSLVYALDQYKVVGPNTNVQFLKDLITHPGFIAGDVETGFIAVSLR
jgi:3-methylcrotonyl-CoA carboxylase alpha subunit